MCGQLHTFLSRFELVYEVEIQRSSLKTSLTIKNTGNDDFDFTTLLHTYLKVPDIQECTISGFQGCSYVDKVTQHVNHYMSQSCSKDDNASPCSDKKRKRQN